MLVDNKHQTVFIVLFAYSLTNTELLIVNISHVCVCVCVSMCVCVHVFMYRFNIINIVANPYGKSRSPNP